MSQLLHLGDLLTLILLSNSMKLFATYAIKTLQVLYGQLNLFFTTYFWRGLSQADYTVKIEFTENATVEPINL